MLRFHILCTLGLCAASTFLLQCSTPPESKSNALQSTPDPDLGDASVKVLGRLDPEDLGIACKADKDCARGLVCLEEDDSYFFGSITNGVCTLDCGEKQDACSDFGGDANGFKAYCVGNPESGHAYCMERCLVGVDEAKCHGRSDLACVPRFSANGLLGQCTPLCGSDAECPGDQLCSTFKLTIPTDGQSVLPKGGVCVEPELLGEALKPDGAVCDDASECQGNQCIQDPARSGDVCSSLCVLGDSTTACHRGDPDAPGEICSVPVFGNSAANELGLCLRTGARTEDAGGGD